MFWTEPHFFDIDLAKGVIEGSGNTYQKHLRDLKGLYADQAAFSELMSTRADDVVYEVSDYRPGERVSDLITGMTRMSPGKVGREYFLTRGHIHHEADRPELYFCLKGKGVMLMESPDGDTRMVELMPHTVCYVPPFWIHRSVNVGAEDLLMLFCYPADSGQDYGIIEKAGGMKLRIVEDNKGGWQAIENPAYRGRTEQEAAFYRAQLSKV